MTCRYSIGKRYDNFDHIEDKTHIKKLKEFQKNYEKFWMDAYAGALAGNATCPYQNAKVAVDKYFENFGKPNKLYYTFAEYKIINDLNDI